MELKLYNRFAILYIVHFRRACKKEIPKESNYGISTKNKMAGLPEHSFGYLKEGKTGFFVPAKPCCSRFQGMVMLFTRKDLITKTECSYRLLCTNVSVNPIKSVEISAKESKADLIPFLLNEEPYNPNNYKSQSQIPGNRETESHGPDRQKDRTAGLPFR